MTTHQRRDLLKKLCARNGGIRSELLTVPEKRLGTRMERDGLTHWRLYPGRELVITDAGRAALEAKK
jgi:hypothetical protein